MTQGVALDILREALIVAIKICGPLLLISLLTGLIIAIFQAATQINEQTLTFVPKVIIISLVMLLMGPYMSSVLSEFMVKLFRLMGNI